MALSDLLPSHAKYCPNCQYNLTGTIDGGQSRCPECGFAFTLDELLAMHVSNSEGEPRSLSPHEYRIRGSLLIWIGLAAMAAILIALLAMLSP